MLKYGVFVCIENKYFPYILFKDIKLFTQAVFANTALVTVSKVIHLQQELGRHCTHGGYPFNSSFYILMLLSSQ